MLPDIENRKASRIEFCGDLIDTDRSVKYNIIELNTDGDLKDMWRTYHRRLTKGSIMFEATTFRSVDDMIKMLKRPDSYDNV